jgi:hypothetical protein
LLLAVSFCGWLRHGEDECLSNPIGDFSAHWSDSMSFIRATSSAVCAALSITHPQGYLMDLYQQPGIADTVDFDHTKRHYYMTDTEINPSRIVSIGPVLDLGKPHNREKLS